LIYSANIITSSGQTALDPKRTILKLTKGLIYKVEIDFPSGSAGLAGVMVCDGSYQVWPSSKGEWFTGDSSNIVFEDMYIKETDPFEFVIYSYNTDDTYDHLINIRIGLVSKEVFMARFLPTLSYKAFTEMILNTQAAQASEVVRQKEEIIDQPFDWLVTEGSI